MGSNKGISSLSAWFATSPTFLLVLFCFLVGKEKHRKKMRKLVKHISSVWQLLFASNRPVHAANVNLNTTQNQLHHIMQGLMCVISPGKNNPTIPKPIQESNPNKRPTHPNLCHCKSKNRLVLRRKMTEPKPSKHLETTTTKQASNGKCNQPTNLTTRLRTMPWTVISICSVGL